MDLRTADKTTQIKEMIDRALSRMNTCMPGVIESFDAATQTCTVIPAIQMKVNVNGVESFVDLPPIVEAPLCYPIASGAGFALTLPIRKGDPCLVLFSQRAIDNWHQLGGVQPPEEGTGCRHHDLTDAIVLMAPVPLPEVLGAWEAEGVELRNRDKSSRVTVKDDKVEVQSGPSILTVFPDGTATLVAPTSVTINTPLTSCTGNLQVAGGITSLGTYGVSGGKIQTPGDIESTGGHVKDSVRTMAADRTIYNGHTHPGDSGGTTGTPNQGM